MGKGEFNLGNFKKIILPNRSSRNPISGRNRISDVLLIFETENLLFGSPLKNPFYPIFPRGERILERGGFKFRCYEF
jgi:hypothetical protein